MFIERRCLFHRSSGSSSMGLGIAYCDFSSGETICDGDIRFCEDPEALRQYAFENVRRQLRKAGEMGINQNQIFAW